MARQATITRPSRSQELHKSLIQDLVITIPGVETRNFWKSVMDLARELDAEILKQPFLPDAFRINRERQEIEIHEVVVTSDLTPRKLQAMGAFWGDWDGEGPHDWLPVLYVHKEGTKQPMQIDLCYWYHNAIANSCSVDFYAELDGPILSEVSLIRGGV